MFGWPWGGITKALRQHHNPPLLKKRVVVLALAEDTLHIFFFCMSGVPRSRVRAVLRTVCAMVPSGERLPKVLLTWCSSQLTPLAQLPVGWPVLLLQLNTPIAGPSSVTFAAPANQR